MQHLGKHSPCYVENKDMPFSMNITAKRVLTNVMSLQASKAKARSHTHARVAIAAA